MDLRFALNPPTSRGSFPLRKRPSFSSFGSSPDDVPQPQKPPTPSDSFPQRPFKDEVTYEHYQQNAKAATATSLSSSAWGSFPEFLDWKNNAGAPASGADQSSATLRRVNSASSFGSGVSGVSHPPRHRESRGKRKKSAAIKYSQLGSQESLTLSDRTTSEQRRRPSQRDFDSDFVDGMKDTLPAGALGEASNDWDPSDKGDSVWCCYLLSDETSEPCRMEFSRRRELRAHKAKFHRRQILP